MTAKNCIYSLIFLFGWWSTSAFAQVNMNDSLALVDFYENTNGDEWFDNTNWLSGAPVASWVGVQLSPDGTHVNALMLPENNLSGAVPISMTNLSQIQQIDFFDNDLTFLPDFSNQPITFVNVDQNRLGFDSFEAYFMMGFPPFPFIFQNQKLIGPTIDTLIPLGAELFLENQIGGTQNSYQWFLNNQPFLGGMLFPDGSLQLNLDAVQLSGQYFVEVQNDLVPDVVLFGTLTFLQVVQLDTIGGYIKPNQVIVKLEDGIHPDTAASIRDEFQAVKLDSIMCRDIELWGLPDTIFSAAGDTIIEPEEKKNKIRSKPKVEAIDFNHIVDDVDNFVVSSHIEINARKSPRVLNSMTDSVIIAIVDTGIDTAHQTLAGNLWNNQLESKNGLDQDGNCIPDDVLGFNFESGTDSITDADPNGHGTHVAGIILAQADPIHHFSLMTLRMYDDRLEGDLFAMISSVYYAASKGAKVINISAGYYGVASEIMPLAFEEARMTNEAIIVASAGNSAVNNDSVFHWPSNYRIPNLISVAALNPSEDSLAFYSNYSRNLVDIAAPGTMILSSVPGGGMAEKSGTSMAAAYLSGVISNMVILEPELTAEQIVQCVKNNTSPISGGDTLLTSGGKIDEGAVMACLASIETGLQSELWLDFVYDPLADSMSAPLANQGLLPPSEPFSSAGVALTDGQGESINYAGLTKVVVDWIIIGLRNSLDSSNIIGLRPAIILSDGQIVMPSGSALLQFPSVPDDEYFVTIQSRNYLPIITQSTIEYNRSQSQLNFKVSTSLAADTTIFLDVMGQQVLVGGDGNNDFKIDALDRNFAWNLRNSLGYLQYDVNLDGKIDAADRNIIWNNRNKNANFPP